jgi:two-component system response regulator YesN
MYNIIIVDDEPLVCRWLTEKIDWSRWNCEVAGVGHNGLEAVALMEKHKPDILLSDVKMPGMNGLELAGRVLEKHPRTLVLMLSGYNEFDYIRSAMRNRVFDYLLKPLDFEEFHRTMDKAVAHLERQSQRRRNEEISSRKLEDSSELTESGILLKLIMNHGKELPSLQSKITRLGLDLGKGQVVVYQMHDNIGPEREKWTSVYPFAIQNILAETFERHHLTPVIFHIGDRCVVVAKFAVGIPIPLWEKRVNEAAQEGLDNVKMYLKSAQSLGIGRVFKSLGNLHGSYQTAVEQLEQRYFWLNDRMPMSGGDSPRPDEVPFAIAPTFYERIENGDTESALAEFGAMTVQLRKLGKREFVYSVYTEILIRLSKISEKWNRDLDFLRLMSGMKDGRTFESLMNEIGETVASLSGWIAERKAFAVASLGEKIVMYVGENYTSPDMTLAALSEHFHISLSHLSRMFVRATGMNFNEYLSNLRMEHARQLMEREHWLSNQEIAERVGYNDGRYFGQVFKKHYGKTPNEFRGRRESKV